jgi:hypothetical protein
MPRWSAIQGGRLNKGERDLIPTFVGNFREKKVVAYFYTKSTWCDWNQMRRASNINKNHFKNSGISGLFKAWSQPFWT